MERLEEVLRRFLKHGIHVKWVKCRFLRPKVDLLGHRVDAKGIHTTKDKLQAIVQAPTPKNIQELRSFLGLINYYGKFIPNAATILHPLNNLLHKNVKWEWSEECQRSFTLAKERLTSSEVLTHYNPSLPIRMAGDASAYGIGAVIAHILPDGSEHPIAFASRTLSSSEQNYAQVEKEALSLVFGVKHFHTYLYGRHFTLVTDHKPLTAILNPKKGIPSLAAARMQRWAWILSAYHYDIEFRPTAQHANADGLSRLPLAGFPQADTSPEVTLFNISQMEALPVTVRQLRAATGADPLLSKVFRYTRTAWPQNVPSCLRPFYDRQTELTVEEGCVLWGFRVVIPQCLREKLLHELHHDHPGMTKMKSVARSYMWWPGLDCDIENLAKSCQSCQAVKRAPPVAPLHPWVWPSRPWQRVHLDFAGPFQNLYFLVGVDAYSKWPEVRVMTTTTVAKTLDVLRDWFSMHGIPEHIVTDNGPQFTAGDFETFVKRNGSAPYHPASNGLAERFIQSLKQSLRASQDSGRSMSQRVSSYLLMYRTTAHATTGVPPCKLFMQRELRTRFSLLQPECEKTVLDKQVRQKLAHDRRSQCREWVLGDRVMVRSFQPGPDWIPGRVQEVLGPVTYIVTTDEGHRWKRHADQLKVWREPTPSTGSDITDVSPEMPSPLPSLAPTAAPTPLEDLPQLPGTAVEAETSSVAGQNSDGSTTVTPPDAGDPVTTGSATAERRYPLRDRRPVSGREPITLNLLFVELCVCAL